MLIFLDYSLLVFHVLLTAFNALGWIYKPTRKLHLAVICLTLASWTVLGVFFGWGYCPITDWQWQVKRALGETPLPNSFIKYCLDGCTGGNSDPLAVMYATVIVAAAAFILSCTLNALDWWRQRRSPIVEVE